MKAPTSGGGDFELPPAGLTVGTCFKVIDLGTQEGSYKGKPKLNHQILVAFELPKHRMQFEKDGVEKDLPMSISKRYNLTFSAKARLRQDMEQWYGKKFDDKQIEASGGFDPSKILGRPAQIMIVHSEDGKYANIEGLMPLAEGMAAPDQENPSVLFDLDDIDWDIWDSFTDGMQSWIGKSPEMNAALNARGNVTEPAPAGEKEDYDDIPF